MEEKRRTFKHLSYRDRLKIEMMLINKASTQEIADALNISNVYLSTLFRKETGQKFSTYVNDYRLTKASELIDRGETKYRKGFLACQGVLTNYLSEAGTQ